MSTPTLIFNPETTIALGSAFVVLDSSSIVTDGGNTLGAIRITLGSGVGSLGVAVGGTLTTTGTIGTIAYLYEPTKRLLSLTSETATGADFTQVLRLIGYSRGSSQVGISQSICVNLGMPIYSTETGHYYEVVSGPLSWTASNTAANAKTFLGLSGYLASVKSAGENNFLRDRFRAEGWIGGLLSSSGSGSWSWSAGPESGNVFWNGDVTGSAPIGQYTNWASGEPSNLENEPYILFGYSDTALWNNAPNVSLAYYVEYSTASGTGDDGLSGTRKAFVITVQSAEAAVIAALVQSTTAIEVSLVNGVVTNTIGVPIDMVTIGATNTTHIQVSINLGTSNSGKRRQPQGFRLVNGAERDLVSTRTRFGEVYNFVFLKTVDGSSSVNLLLN